MRHVLSDFAKAERAGSRRCATAIADNAELLARGEDASFQNKVHLAMDGEGFSTTRPDDRRHRTDS